jgi:biopolymer transport protein ExbD
MRARFTTVKSSVKGDVNTTPLIDVMLVLLILCEISIPAKTHRVAIDLPKKGVASQRIDYVLNLDDAGQLSWNGTRTNLAKLPRQLEELNQNPLASLELSASGGAAYEDYDRLLATVKRSRVERIALVGNRQFARELDR